MKYDISWLATGLTSADIARERLHGIVAADRVTAPCGHWAPTALTRIHKLKLAAGLLGGMRIKPRYRWEQRR